MATPSTLNGFPVIRHTDHANGWATVMVHIPENAFTPYCVATWWPGLSSWSWGHYEQTREDADARYAEVEQRNAKRGKA